MYISTSKSKNVTIYYVCKSFRKDGGTTSKRIETLGTVDDIRRRCGDSDPMEWARNYARELTEKDNVEHFFRCFSAIRHSSAVNSLFISEPHF